MPYCGVCGKKATDEAKYCQACGSKIPSVLLSEQKLSQDEYDSNGCTCDPLAVKPRSKLYYSIFYTNTLLLMLSVLAYINKVPLITCAVLLGCAVLNVYILVNRPKDQMLSWLSLSLNLLALVLGVDLLVTYYRHEKIGFVVSLTAAINLFLSYWQSRRKKVSTIETSPKIVSHTKKSVTIGTVLEWSAYALFAIFIVLFLLNPNMLGRRSSQILGWIFLTSIVFGIRLVYLLFQFLRSNKDVSSGNGPNQ